MPRASARPACARLCPREVAGTARGEGTAQGGPPRPPRWHTPGNAPSQLAFPGRLPGPPWGVPGRRRQPGRFVAPRVTTNSPAFAAPPRRLVRAAAFSCVVALHRLLPPVTKSLSERAPCDRHPERDSAPLLVLVYASPAGGGRGSGRGRWKRVPGCSPRGSLQDAPPRAVT